MLNFCIRVRVLVVIFFISGNFFGNIATVSAQSIDTLIYVGDYTIPFRTVYKNQIVEELSGIEYSGNNKQYYLIPQSRNKTHLFLSSINLSATGLEVTMDSVIYLEHGPLEAESIRVHPKSGQLYIAEEGNGTSYVHVINEKNELTTVYSSTEAQRHNRGYEGLCFNTDGSRMLMGLERAEKGDVTHIISLNLEDRSEIVYDYKLDILTDDKKKDNGITELLMINDSTLIVVERAFLGPENGTSVRVYKAKIIEKNSVIEKIKLLTTFSASPEIDNIEGVTFSASGKELIFVSDNNGNKHQKNLFICMKIQ